MPDTGPKARSIPAGGNAPCDQRNKSPSANGAVHPFRVVRCWVVNGAWRGMERAFSPCGVCVPIPGALPQAGMATRRWRSDSGPTRQCQPGPKARPIPAWANGPGSWPDELPRAESPLHYFGRSCSCHVDLPRQQTRQQQVARPAEVLDLGVERELLFRKLLKNRLCAFLHRTRRHDDGDFAQL